MVLTSYIADSLKVEHRYSGTIVKCFTSKMFHHFDKRMRLSNVILLVAGAKVNLLYGKLFMTIES